MRNILRDKKTYSKKFKIFKFDQGLRNIDKYSSQKLFAFSEFSDYVVYLIRIVYSNIFVPKSIPFFISSDTKKLLTLRKHQY